MDIQLYWLSDTPRMVVCSFEAAQLLGTELFGYLTVVPDVWCPRDEAYAIDVPDPSSQLQFRPVLK